MCQRVQYQAAGILPCDIAALSCDKILTNFSILRVLELNDLHDHCWVELFGAFMCLLKKMFHDRLQKKQLHQHIMIIS